MFRLIYRLLRIYDNFKKGQTIQLIILFNIEKMSNLILKKKPLKTCPLIKSPFRMRNSRYWPWRNKTTTWYSTVVFLFRFFFVWMNEVILYHHMYYNKMFHVNNRFILGLKYIISMQFSLIDYNVWRNKSIWITFPK